MKQTFLGPVKGATDATTFAGQSADATDPDGMLNMVPTDSDGRRVLATRDKLALEFGGAVNTGPVACIGDIARASGVTGLTYINAVRSTAGTNRPAGTWRGQFCMLHAQDRSVQNVWADTRGTYVDGTPLANPPSGEGGFGGFEVCWHSTDATIGYGATVAADINASDSNGGTVGGTSGILVGLNRFSTVTGDITHQKYCIDADAPYTVPTTGTAALLANKLLQWGPYLFVAVQRYVYVFDASDLTYIKRHEINWTEEVQCIQAATVRGVDYLFVLSTGVYTVAGPVVNDGGATPDRYGEHYRCSIMPHAISYSNATTKSAVAVGADVLTRKAMPQATQTGDAGHEDHRTFRFSDWGVSRPRGCLAWSFALEVTSDADVYCYVVRCNQGFGYDGGQTNQRPDGQAPFISVCRCVLTRGFEPGAPRYIAYGSEVRYGFSAGVGGWERDTGSLRRSFPWHGSTYQNDIPIITAGLRDPELADNEPTLKAAAIDTTNRRLFVAGRSPYTSAAGPNVICLDMDNGDLIWEQDVGGKVAQNAIAVDPVSKNLLVAMRRNDDWTRPDGTSASPLKAEVLELSGTTGQTLNQFDLTDAISFNSLITNETIAANLGMGAYGVAVNSLGQVLVALAPFRFDT